MDQPLKPPTKVPSKDESPGKPRSRRGLLAPSLIVLLLIGGVVWWTRHHAAQQQTLRHGRIAPPTSIAEDAVRKGDIGVTLNALGTVTSLATVTIRSQISGYLMKIDFKEGAEVKKGDLLAEIDPRPYKAALAQAQGQLARDEALLKGAQVDLVRYQGLAAQKAVPHQTLDTQVALVAQDQGTVEADRAAVQSAQVNLNYTRIVSPIDGRVGLRQVDQGNYVTANDATGLVVITKLTPISVLFTVPEKNLQAIAKRLRAGAVLPVTAFDSSGANQLAEGKLSTFDSQIDPTTGTIKLRALFSNDQRKLYPNQFVNIRLLLDTHKNVDTMSTAAIQRGVPGTFVYLVNPNNTVSVRPVQLGVTDGDRVEVRSGLVPGDHVVIDGADKLRDGAKVAVRPPTGAAVSPGSAATQGQSAPNGKSGVKGQRSQGGHKQ